MNKQEALNAPSNAAFEHLSDDEFMKLLVESGATLEADNDNTGEICSNT